MSTKGQFKMYLDPEMVARLEALAARHGRRSGQQIAEEILHTYLPVWSAVADATRRAVEFQSKGRQGVEIVELPVDLEITDGREANKGRKTA